MCDGIIEGEGTKEITSRLHQETRWECDADFLGEAFEMLKENSEAPFLMVKDRIPSFKEGPYYRWIFVTSKNLIMLGDMQMVLERASSLFIELQKSDSNMQGLLPNGFFKHCVNLTVLVLSNCAFSFVSPPFLRCHRLRFLGLDHCTHDNTSKSKEKNNTEWACLRTLLVLDIRYTYWDEILSEEKMDLMASLMELNIEGVSCWQYTRRLHGRLPHIQRLRIIKPTQKADTSSTDISNSLVDRTKLEILDLSGNRDMENLSSISSSVLRSVQMLVLDGCDGLEDVVVPDGPTSSLLRLFSFDGYGPAAHWMPSFELPLESSRPKHPPPSLVRIFLWETGVEKRRQRVMKTTKISLQGCTQLENLFVRGLPNLVELDLSGSAIKVLDLEATLVDVPELKRIILLGCEHLRNIKWGPFGSGKRELMLRIDTRPWRARRFSQPSLAQSKNFRLQLHAILADTRLAWSLEKLMGAYQYEDISSRTHVTSSTEYGGGVQVEATGTEMVGHSSTQEGRGLARRYADIFPKIGVAPMLDFSQPSYQESDRHLEIFDGSHCLESKLETPPD